MVIVGTHLAAAPATLAGNDENLSDSGNAFVRTCSAIENPSTASTDPRATVCAAYVIGLSEGIMIESSYGKSSSGEKAPTPYCLADTYEVEQGQKVRILLKYIRNNPETAHMITAGIFINAMGDAFPPCPQRK
jgi:hypothetical protein